MALALSIITLAFIVIWLAAEVKLAMRKVTRFLRGSSHVSDTIGAMYANTRNAKQQLDSKGGYRA